jgi:hypothetical protein
MNNPSNLYLNLLALNKKRPYPIALTADGRWVRPSESRVVTVAAMRELSYPMSRYVTDESGRDLYQCFSIGEGWPGFKLPRNMMGYDTPAKAMAASLRCERKRFRSTWGNHTHIGWKCPMCKLWVKKNVTREWMVREVDEDDLSTVRLTCLAAAGNPRIDMLNTAFYLGLDERTGVPCKPCRMRGVSLVRGEWVWQLMGMIGSDMTSRIERSRAGHTAGAGHDDRPTSPQNGVRK